MRARTVSLAFTHTLGAIAAAAIAAAPLPRTGWVLLLLAGAGGALWDRLERHRIPNLALTIAGGAGFFLSLLPLRPETLAEQSLTALSFLLAVKLLGRKSRRDHLQVLGASLLIVAGSASLDPRLLFGALLAGTLILGVLFLLWLPFSETIRSIDAGLMRRLALIGGALAGASAPITLLLFLVLPRSLNPFWSGLAARPPVGVSGVSDQLRLGDVGRVALSGEVAFRAELEEGRALASTPYWRGAVLEVTDGRRWQVSGSARATPTSSSAPGTRVTYFVEPHGERQLFLLETPTGAAIASRLQSLGASRVLRLGAPLTRRLRYVATSRPADHYAERLLPEERALNLRLPPDLPQSIVALASAIAGPIPVPAPQAAAAAERLRLHFSRDYTYSLQVPPFSGDPLEAFLLRHRTGYCEYFASGLAVMLRAVGIPARVVSGYLGGQWVAAGSYYLVTQASAHAWVEAYLDGEWVRLDPTPAAEADGLTFAARRSRRTLLWLDALRMRWNSWVVQYDAETQFSLVRSGASRARRLRLDGARIAAALAGLLAAAAFLVVAAAVLRRRRLGSLGSRIVRYRALAARHGAARAPHEGPLDHAARFARARPGAAAAILAFGRLSAACGYGGREVDAAALARLDELLAAIRSGSADRPPADALAPPRGEP